MRGSRVFADWFRWRSKVRSTLPACSDRMLSISQLYSIGYTLLYSKSIFLFLRLFASVSGTLTCRRKRSTSIILLLKLTQILLLWFTFRQTRANKTTDRQLQDTGDVKTSKLQFKRFLLVHSKESRHVTLSEYQHVTMTETETSSGSSPDRFFSVCNIWTACNNDSWTKGLLVLGACSI